MGGIRDVELMLPVSVSVCGLFAAEYSPFYGIEKSAVLQEARCFNDRELDPRRCAQVRD